MLSFTGIRSPFTVLAQYTPSSPEGLGPVRWRTVGNWWCWVAAKAGRPLRWHLVTFLLSPLGPPFEIWCSLQGCNPNQMWDLVSWSFTGGGASGGISTLFWAEDASRHLCNISNLRLWVVVESDNKRLVCRKSPVWESEQLVTFLYVYLSFSNIVTLSNCPSDTKLSSVPESSSWGQKYIWES